MAEKIFRFRCFKDKGPKIPVKVLDHKTWNQLVALDPTIPRSFVQLRNFGRLIFDKKKKRKYQYPSKFKKFDRGVITRLFEECGESLYNGFFVGLQNPYLTAKQRDLLEADADADAPTFENEKESEHFIFRWTNTSADTADNIADSSIIDDTCDYMEKAWDKYNTTFSKAPYVATGNTKIEVIFHDISGYGVASPPDGPIQFDAQSWVNIPGIRKPTSAHELFHKLQYAFGYRTTWTPSGSYKWFSEGAASWSEVFVWGRVSGSYKVTDLFSNPDMNLYDASYRALVFWIFLQTRLQDSPGDNAIISFLQKYETTGDMQGSLAEVVNEDWPPANVYSQLDNFFALFSRERRIGAWKMTPTGGQLYPTILDPDGNDIATNLTVTEATLGSGDAYANTTAVSQLGSDYYKFVFENNTDGKILSVSCDGSPTGDYSFYLIWEKDESFKRAIFPFAIKENYSFSETLDLNFANNLVLIVSGRGIGGNYHIDASVS